jgi:hypothetical protein
VKILIQYPSRQRAYRFAEGLFTIRGLSVIKDEIIVNVVLDNDDPQLTDYVDILKRIDDIPILISFGKSESKIDAINRPLPPIDWDILLTFSDDMRFMVYGWDVHVREHFKNKTLDRFVHFFEKHSGNRVSVMDVVGRTYYERDGFIYNPVYLSLFCDEEKTEIARLRGCYVFDSQPIFEHANAAVTGVGIKDEQLIEQQKLGWSIDQATFLKRKEINFGL